MESAKDFRIVFVSVSNYEQALQMARTLVSEQLAACCNVVPGITSVFGWHGNITESQEFMLHIKTSKARLGMLENRITELHTFDVPEIISVGLEESSAPYLAWLQGSLPE